MSTVSGSRWATKVQGDSLAQHVQLLCTRTLDAWRANPDQVEKDFREEENLLFGGYGNRQLLELVQNAVDAAGGRTDARCELCLLDNVLYAANEGAPLDASGARALIMGQLSPKRSNEIGRFGLGFRSLLRFGGKVDFFSAGIGMQFDPLWCAEQARNVAQLASNSPAPGFRLVRLLDIEEEASRDPILRSLSWADTIVRMELGNSAIVEMVRHAFKSFPAEFVLFTGVSVDLRMLVGDTTVRSIRRSIRGENFIVHDAAALSRWRVFSRREPVEDKTAIEEAGSVHAREAVQVSWAVRTDATEPQAGSLWAFFPTQTHSALPGILNAHWKVNTDRTALTGDSWNAALMQIAARLVLESLIELGTGDNPGVVLDAFPRPPIRRGDAYAVLATEVWSAMPHHRFLPAADGTLAKPIQLLRPQYDENMAYEKWLEILPAERKIWVVDLACVQTAHRQEMLSKLSAFMHQVSGARTDLKGTAGAPEAVELLVALAGLKASDDSRDERVVNLSGVRVNSDPGLARMDFADALRSAATRDAQQCIRLLEVGALVARKYKSVRSMLPSIAIIPAMNGSFQRGDSLLLLPELGAGTDPRAVDGKLLERPNSETLLIDFYGVRKLDGDEVWMKMLEAQWADSRNLSADQLLSNHIYLAAAPPDVRKAFLAGRKHRVRVKLSSGTWYAADRVLLEGRIVRSDRESDGSALCVDRSFAERFAETLALLRVTDMPAPEEMLSDVNLQTEVRNALYEYYLRSAATRTKPHQGTLNFVSGSRRPLIGAVMLKFLQGAVLERLTRVVIRQIAEVVPLRTELGPDGSTLTNSKYPDIQVPDPSTWFVLRYGRIKIGESTTWAETVLALSRQLGARSSQVLGELHDLVQPLHVRIPDNYEFEVPDMQACWDALAMRLRGAPTEKRVAAWEAGASIGLMPSVIPGANSDRDIPVHGVFITRERWKCQLAKSGVVAELVGPQAYGLWSGEGVYQVDSHITYAFDATSSQRAQLVDLAPGSAECWEEGTSFCLFVDGLTAHFLSHSCPVEVAYDKGVFLVSAGWWRRVQRDVALRAIGTLASDVGVLRSTLDEFLDRCRSGMKDAVALRVADAGDLPAKIVILANEKASVLREILPEEIREALPARVPRATLAQLVLDVFGSATLRRLQSAAPDNLCLPRTWGNSDALETIRSLGFPDAFAGAGNPRVVAEVFVHGPPVLRPLHPYQVAASNEILETLRSQELKRGLVLSLPTGAGKTRVAVQSVVKFMNESEDRRRLIVWLAQTVELAVQAVSAFQSVWRAHGLADSDLRIVQFWGSGVRNPLPSAEETPTVVVSVVSMLRIRISDSALDWLRNAEIVVIDESHHAIAPEYTELLHYFGISTGNQKSPVAREPALVGLSATPFRSSGAQESHRLAARFQRRVVPAKQDKLYSDLLAEGFLAKLEVDEVSSNQELRLTADELEHSKTFGDLPPSAAQRLAENELRNTQIVRLIAKAPEQSVLVFAATVKHATLLAGLLSLAGVRAAVVSGESDRSERQYAIEQFKRGDIRVLCNAQLLTTGFDAPRVDLIVIARPVFSKVRFTQMVGRGMRGPRNGGTESCRVLTITDNVRGMVAFNSIEWWRSYYS